MPTSDGRNSQVLVNALLVEVQPTGSPGVRFEDPNAVSGDVNLMGHWSDLPTYQAGSRVKDWLSRSAMSCTAQMPWMFQGGGGAGVTFEPLECLGSVSRMRS